MPGTHVDYVPGGVVFAPIIRDRNDLRATPARRLFDYVSYERKPRQAEGFAQVTGFTRAWSYRTCSYVRSNSDTGLKSEARLVTSYGGKATQDT